MKLIDRNMAEYHEMGLAYYMDTLAVIESYEKGGLYYE